MAEHGWYPPGTIFTRRLDMSIDHIVDLVKTGALDLDPTFQRRNTWNRHQQSEFIESLLLGIPVPPLYFAEEPHGRMSVIDGKNRLTAIIDFIGNEFELSSLKLASELNGMTFRQLPLAAKRRLHAGSYLSVVLLPEQNDPEIKYETFLRLNASGQSLTRQEVRNATYAGPLNELAIELSEEPFLLHQLNIESRSSHLYANMTNVEYVLRFMALSEAGVILDKGINSLIDRFMEKHRFANAKMLSDLRSRFIRSLRACEEIWGDLAFMRLDTAGYRRQLASTIYDAQMLACARVSNEVLLATQNRRQSAIEGMRNLFSNSHFRAISKLTPYSLAGVQARVDAVQSLLENTARA